MILGVGEIVWDCLPSGCRLGGAPVNFAYHAMQLGAESYPVSAVGTDSLGKETLEECRSYGLPTDYIRINNLPTSRVLVSLDGNGVPSYEIVENVAWDALEATPEVLSLARRADAICWGSLSQRSGASRKTVCRILAAAPASALKVFDINLRQHYYCKEVVEASLRHADILKLNEDELPIVLSMTRTAGIGELISRYSLNYLVYTCGAAFSEVHGQQGLMSRIDTPKVTVADTVGAGDCFTAAFVTSLLRGASPQESHRAAVSLSARLCTLPGAINPLPENLDYHPALKA